MPKCPVIPGRDIRADGTCTRYHLCSDEHIALCGARPPGSRRRSTPYGKRKAETGKGCQHKHTKTIPTRDKVIIDGEQRTVFEVVCKECRHTRRMIL